MLKCSKYCSIPQLYFHVYLVSLLDFDHNSIHYRARHPNLSWRPRSYSCNSYYSSEPSAAIHHGNVRINEDKIIMTPVTPDQSIRGLDSTWSIVPGHTGRTGHDSGQCQSLSLL